MLKLKGGLPLTGSPLFLFFLFAISFLFYLTILWSARDPIGEDGYYYLKQIEVLYRTQRLYFPDPSFAFLIPVFFMFCGLSSLMAFHLSVSLCFGALVTGAAALTLRLQTSPWSRIAAGLIPLYFALHPLWIDFVSVFFKNLVALGFLIWAVNFLIAYQSSRARRDLLGSAGLFVMALLSHKSSVVFLGLLFLAFVLSGRLNRRSLWMILALGIGGALIFVTYYAKGIEFLQHIPNFVSKPRNFYHWWSVRSPYAYRLLYIAYCLFLARVLAMFADPEERSLLRRDHWLWVVAILCCVVLQPFQSIGLGSPFMRFFYMLLIFVVPYSCYFALRRSSGGRRWLSGLTLLALASNLVFWKKNLYADHLFPWSNLRPNIRRLENFVKPSDLLISHHGLEFFVDYTTNIRSRSLIPPNAPADYYRLLYVGSLVEFPEDFWPDLERRMITRISPEYVLIRESDWRYLKYEYVILNHWKNPSKKRPAYIYE